MGEDEVEAGVLRGAGEGGHVVTPRQRAPRVLSPSVSNCPWGIPHLGPDHSWTPGMDTEPRVGH